MSSCLARAPRAAGLLLAVVTSLLMLAQPSQAEVTAITAGEVQWGVKHSFRDYILGGVAKGSMTAADGAQLCDGSGVCDSDGTVAYTDAALPIGPDVNDYFRLPVTGGTFDDATNTLELLLGGTISFYGHDDALNITLSRLRVVLRDGASFMVADIDDRPIAGGPPEFHTDVNMARIDITGKYPTVESGTTEWPLLSSALTAAGAPAFGGKYYAGDELDQIRIEYLGPGGVPKGDEFSAPNTPVYAAAASAPLEADVVDAWFDADAGVVHVLTAQRLVALDADTLEVVDAVEAPSDEVFWSDGNTFAASISTVLAAFADGEEPVSTLQAFRFDENHYSQSNVGIPARRSVAWSSSLNRVYSVATAASGDVTPSLNVADHSAGTYTPRPAYTEINSGGKTVLDVVGAAGGQLLGTYAPVFSGVVPNVSVTRQPVVRLVDNGSELLPTEIVGTQILPPTRPLPASYGYGHFDARPDGSVGILEQSPSMATRGLATLTPSGAAQGGFALTGTPLTLDHQPSDFGTDDNGDLYIGTHNSVDVYRAGTHFASFPFGGPVSDVVGGSGKAYVVGSHENAQKIVAYSLKGYTPTITAQPIDPGPLVLPAKNATTEVLLSTTAESEPLDVRWQRRAVDTGDWVDIAEADSAELTLSVGPTNDGDSVRAVWSNEVGSLATDVITFDVRVHDTVPPQIAITSPAPGATTTEAAVALYYNVSDNSDPAPQCTIANGQVVPLQLGANTITLFCVDESGNVASLAVTVVREVQPAPALPAPAAVSIKAVKKTLRVKQRGSRRIEVAKLTCRSQTTCVYKLPKSVTVKLRGKKYKLKLSGPKRLEPKRSKSIRVTLSKKFVRALKGRKATLKLSVKVSNAAGVAHRKSGRTSIRLRG